jgi:hypothetical protein
MYLTSGGSAIRARPLETLPTTSAPSRADQAGAADDGSRAGLQQERPAAGGHEAGGREGDHPDQPGGDAGAAGCLGRAAARVNARPNCVRVASQPKMTISAGTLVLPRDELRLFRPGAVPVRMGA